jgi:hypothetical protein
LLDDGPRRVAVLLNTAVPCKCIASVLNCLHYYCDVTKLGAVEIGFYNRKHRIELYYTCNYAMAFHSLNSMLINTEKK